MPMRAPNAAAAGVRSRYQRPLRSIVTRRRPHHLFTSDKDERCPGRSTKALPGGGAAEAARRGSDDAETTHQQRQSSGGGGGGFSLGSGATAQRRTGGDWAAVRDSGVPGGKGLDMLAELGAAQDYNINVDHGQSAQFIDSLFVGKFLGTKADIASGELRNYEMRSFGNLVGDYYVAPKFLEAVTMHIAKNIMCDQGAFDNMRVPLILGIWGGKGQGKSFQTELAFKKLGVLPIIMSAGELENEWAGTPGDLIRERYKKAASIIKNQGKMSCLMINDLDAGIGRFTDTQCTVNNQMVFGTLMNICDDPNVVSTGEKWREEDRIPRVPIIVTGNDLSRLYAPLIRDGRMEKFYWRPTEEDRLNILHAMFKDDGLTMDDMATLLREFPNQSLDFFGAMRSGCYDHYIRGWLAAEIGQGEDMNDWGESHTKELRRRLIFKERLPDVETCDITMDQLLREGRRLVEEQEHVLRNKLSEEYFKDLVKEKETMARMEEVAARPPPPSPPPENNWRVDTTHILDREMAAARAAGTIEYLEVGLPGLEEEAEEEVDDSPWPRLDPDRAMALVKEEGYVFVDIRQPKDFERDRFQGSVSIPAVSVAGFGAGAAVAPVAEFVGNMLAKFSDLDSKLLLCGGSAAGVAGAEETEAIAQLQAAGYANLAEVRGGYPEWSRLFRHNGERRWTFSSMQHLGDSHSLHM